MLDSFVQECRHAALAAALFVGLIISPALDAQTGTGSIAGVVTTKATALRPLRVTIDQRVCGNELPDESVVVDGAGHLANAVVTLAGLKTQSVAGTGGITNEKCRFVPRVQIVRPHATITTTSKDPMLHTTNAAMDGGKTLFNVAVPVPGIKINKQIAGPGIVRVFCNTHTWMRGFIFVTDEASAVSGEGGRFTLSNLPPGTYSLRIWHESLRGTPQNVKVAANQTATANFELK